MNFIPAHSVRRFFRLSWLTGPLFDKELRISSRRRRNYVLRFAYVILLTLFVAIVWLSVAKFYGTSTFEKSRMAMAGKRIITTIVSFQFFATQLIAVIMLSNSISDEIYHRTLGVLMTTPINSLQIVMGKLFSKLFQIILLLAISVPLLAIVRIFGGVPWDYILSSLCITITAVIFAGSLSLYFSIFNRRAYVVIIKTVVTYGTFFMFIPALIFSRFSRVWLNLIINWPMMRSLPKYTSPLIHINPIGAMSVNTAKMLSPAGGFPFFYWPIHCIFMLAVSALLVSRSIQIVRKVALRQATGSIELIPKFRLWRKNDNNSVTYSGIVREVTGLPVLWKELRAPMIQGGEGRNSIIGLIFAVIALLITYGVFSRHGYLGEDFAHVMYAIMFVIIGSIFLMVLSATCITSEKESSAWPILLVTSMDDWNIILGKAAGVFYKCMPVWLLFAGHVLIFTIVGFIHPIAIVHLFIFLTGLSTFLTGLGLYCSARFKRTTWAIVANFAFILILWAVIPIVLGISASIINEGEFFEVYFSTNPVYQAGVIMYGAAGQSNANTSLSGLEYDWPMKGRDKSVFLTTGILLIYMLIYILGGLFFAWRAKCRFRRNIF